MKSHALIAAFLLIAGVSTAVVDGPNNSEGDMVITNQNSGSTSASTGVGPNGTQYQTTFSVVNKSTSANQTGIIDSNFNSDSVNFEGVIETPTPCYSISHSVERIESGKYSFVVNAKDGNSSTCTQVLAYHSYEANFTAEEPFQLTVKHGNSSVGTLTHAEYSESSKEEKSDEDQGLFTGFLNFINDLF